MKVCYQIIVTIVFGFIAMDSFASDLTYHLKDIKKNKIIDVTQMNFVDNPDGSLSIQLDIIKDDDNYTNHYVLNSDYTTRVWDVRLPSERTEYKGIRENQSLKVKGLLKGREFDKKIKIDERPFYYSPIVGLKKFVLSDEEQMECWSFRSSNLKPYEMMVRKYPKETIQHKGQDTLVVPVSWTPKGWIASQFDQLFYFRADNGVYITQRPFRNFRIDLVSDAS